MVDTSGPAEWSASYAQYLLRAAQQSARTLDLHYLVLRRVASGDLTPLAVNGVLTDFVERRGRDYADRVAGLGSRLMEGLVQAAAGASEPPPRYTPEDPAAWTRALAEYVSRVMQRPAPATRSHMSVPGSTVAAIAGEGTAHDPLATVQTVGRLYLELLGGLSEITSALEEEYLRAVLAAHEEAPTHRLELRAAPGDVTSAVLSVENTRPEPARVRCVAADVRRADGVGPAFVPRIAFDPEDPTIAPAAAIDIRVSLTLDPSVFANDAPYVGHVHLVRDDAPRVDVPLRIVAASPSSAAPPARHGEAR